VRAKLSRRSRALVRRLRERMAEAARASRGQVVDERALREMPPLVTTHPDDEHIDARCPGRRAAPAPTRRSDALQARSTGAAPFGGGSPERPELVRCGGTRARVLVRHSGRVRGLTLACTKCGHTWTLTY